MKRFVAKVKQDGMIVAVVESVSMADCEREIQHYARQYRQDGPVEIIRKYKLVTPTKAALATGEPKADAGGQGGGS